MKLLNFRAEGRSSYGVLGSRGVMDLGARCNLAPAGFGSFAGDLLVGNFGNGRVSAYAQNGSKWVYKGQLRLADGTPIAIAGLWAIAFGNGAASGPATTLYFLSGPADEKHGLFGSITAG